MIRRLIPVGWFNTSQLGDRRDIEAIQVRDPGRLCLTQPQSGIEIYMIARNMGTSVAMIEAYYGKSDTPAARAAQLGGHTYG